MKKTTTTKSTAALVTILATLTGAFLFPVSAVAEQKSSGYHKKDQNWQQRREERRVHAPHRRAHRNTADSVIRTDHRAVQRRVAHHRASKARIKQASKHHRQHVRYHNRRDHYINHLGDRRHYNRHSNHYHRYHASRHTSRRHHSHDRDYLEWLAVMVLLDDIYDDGYR